MVLHSPREELAPDEFKLWRLQLVLTHSDGVVLFEHEECGVAVAEIVRDVLRADGNVNPTGQQIRRTGVEGA